MSTPYFVPHWPKSGGQKKFVPPTFKTDCLVYNLKVIYIQMFEVASDHFSFCFYSRPAASISTIRSDHRLVFDIRLVFSPPRRFTRQFTEHASAVARRQSNINMFFSSSTASQAQPHTWYRRDVMAQQSTTIIANIPFPLVPNAMTLNDVSGGKWQLILLSNYTRNSFRGNVGGALNHPKCSTVARKGHECNYFLSLGQR